MDGCGSVEGEVGQVSRVSAPSPHPTEHARRPALPPRSRALDTRGRKRNNCANAGRVPLRQRRKVPREGSDRDADIMLLAVPLLLAAGLDPST
eukprot:4016622-Prymnesium_polylepis.4